jgi:hypothetical protein
MMNLKGHTSYKLILSVEEQVLIPIKMVHLQTEKHSYRTQQRFSGRSNHKEESFRKKDT